MKTTQERMRELIAANAQLIQDDRAGRISREEYSTRLHDICDEIRRVKGEEWRRKLLRK